MYIRISILPQFDGPKFKKIKNNIINVKRGTDAEFWGPMTAKEDSSDQ